MACLAVAASLLGIRGTQNAVANGDTRTITILHMHTKEETTVTFKQDGRYVPAALEKLNKISARPHRYPRAFEDPMPERRKAALKMPGMA